MENEIVKKENQSFIERLIEKTDSLEEVKKVGMVIIESGFCPEHFRASKDAVGAIMCIEAGRKLGLSWMQSLSDIYPVKGRIGIMGTAAKAVIFASGVLESWEEMTEGEYPQPNYKHITISKRKGLPGTFRTEFSVFDAQTAGLMGKDIYKKYGKRMIAWRDIGFHASDYYQDILKGMKTVEELNDYDGIVPGTPEKVTLKTEDGKEITFTDKDKEHSVKTTSRVASKIPENKFGEIKKDNVQDATIINETESKGVEYKDVEKSGRITPIVKEESPFIADKQSTEYMNGVLVKRDTENNITNMAEIEAGVVVTTDKPGKNTAESLDKLDTKVLLQIVMDDMDMMESCETIGGKNTKKKLMAIILAHESGDLKKYTADNTPKEAKPSEASQNAEKLQGEIPVNKAFDSQVKTPEKKEPQYDAFLDPKPKDEPKKETGNKYKLEIPEFDKGNQRDFASTKALFNRLSSVTPSITSPRYLEIAGKAEILGKYPDKELFCKNATVDEINTLLNSN
jgi:hypothetical protein